jgi:hypothetical protein
MNKKLAGTLFCYNAVSQDYCIKESIISLSKCCDHIFVVDAGSTDSTQFELFNLGLDNVKIIVRDNKEWQEQKGREKLNYFTNIAIEEAEKAGYEWQINLQADEIIHEKSYDAIRKAIEEDCSSYMCKRINLWKSPYLQLDVPQDRLPCSENIIRLAKTKFRSVGDAESIGVDYADFKYLNDIRIYHMGFVRKRDVMKKKAIHIQEEVFGLDHDKKLDGIDYFDPDRWFTNEDLKLIDEPLPEIIKEWAKERVYK